MKRINTDSFITKANIAHNFKYDYSKTNYVNSHSKICIVCSKHGEFWQSPNNHLSGKGCPECKKEKLHSLKSKSKDDFIQEANNIHNEKYDYSKVEYLNNYTKVCIVCPTHGEFWQTPLNHLNGKGCPMCVKRSYQYGINRTHKTLETFIKEAKKVHGNKYDYSKTKYVGANTKICIICPTHGEFWQNPTKHLNGQGCPKCANDRKRLTMDEFIERANKIHNGKYDYSKVNFNYVKDYITIICPKHGEFTQNVTNHLRGHGCQYCNSSLMEQELERELKSNNIEYIPQCSKNEFPWLNLQSFDFYLPKYNIAIECQGEQHFHPIDFSGNSTERSISEFNCTIERDRRKNLLCHDNGIRLIYFTKKKFLKKPNIVIEGEYFFNSRNIRKILNGDADIYKKSNPVINGNQD